MKDSKMLSVGLLKNSARRFWPLWLAYAVTLGLLFVAPAYSAVTAVVRSGESLPEKVSEVESLWVIARIQALCFVSVASIIAATAYNDHLFSSRSATFVGSLPIKREKVFVTQFISGLLPLLGVPALAALCLLPLSLSSGAVLPLPLVGQWLMLMVAFTCVFYSFAQLACQLSGTRPVAVLLYGVINFLLPCLEAALSLVATLLVYGLTSLDLGSEWLAPFVGLAGHAIFGGEDRAVRWVVVAGYDVAALAAAILSCWLYVRRSLESAGDSVSFAPAKTFLKYLAGVSMALLFCTVYCLLRMTTEIEGAPLAVLGVLKLAVSMATGGFLGVLFAEMILSRSARVLGRCWRGGLVVSTAAVLLVLGSFFDVLGLERRVPSPKDVEKVSMHINWSNDMTLSDADSVAAVCELHRDVIAYGKTAPEVAGDDSYQLAFNYALTGGRVLSRSYRVPSAYVNYRMGLQDADEGALLIDRAVAIANSTAGRAARFGKLFDTDVRDIDISLEYYLRDDGEWRSESLSLDERRELVAGPLRTELLEGTAGDITTSLGIGYDDRSEGSYDTNLGINKKDGPYIAGFELSDKDTPELVAWVKKHHPEALVPVE